MKRKFCSDALQFPQCLFLSPFFFQIYSQIKKERAEMKERQMEIDEEYNRNATLSFETNKGKGSKIWVHFRKDGPTKITCIACSASFR